MKFSTSLLLPVLAAPAFALPSSSKPWIVESINYNSKILYSTPAHLAVSNAVISFNVTNLKAGTEGACTGISYGQQYSGGFFPFPQNFTCTGSAADFNYVLGNGKLQINETFTHKNHAYLGIVNTKLDFKCNTTIYNNANWTIGEPYSSEVVQCAPIDYILLTPNVTKLS